MKPKYLYPKNKEYFKKLIPFTKNILTICKTNKIPIIIYGSYSHFYHTKDENMNVNDIDIIISKKDFVKIMILLKDNKINFKYHPLIYRNEMSTIIIKKGRLKVEIDEVGTGYKTLNEKNLSSSTKKINFYGINVKIVTLKQLEDIYQIAYNRTKDNRVKIKKRIKHLEKFLERKLK